jgi:Methyltransferase domain
MEIDPYANDPGRWGASLANLAELLLPCLDAAGPRSVVEVGAYAGDLTGLLLSWAEPSGARVWAIDPDPQPELVQLAEERSDLELIRAPSHEGLREIPVPGAVVLDGDHNYYTVSEELRLVEERADGPLPLVLLHDVCWPHARRDAYFAPDQIPEEHRQPMVEGAGLFPGKEGIYPGGLPYHWAAEREGGERNGVLTAVEDFIADRDDLRLAVVPAFFGLGAVWHREAPWAGAVEEILGPWDRNPLLERLEANRVFHLASTHVQMVQAAQLRRRNQRLEHVLREMLRSRAFTLGEQLSRLHQRGEPAFSREMVRKALSD